MACSISRESSLLAPTLFMTCLATRLAISGQVSLLPSFLVWEYFCCMMSRENLDCSIGKLKSFCLLFGAGRFYRGGRMELTQTKSAKAQEKAAAVARARRPRSLAADLVKLKLPPLGHCLGVGDEAQLVDGPGLAVVALHRDHQAGRADELEEVGQALVA